MANPRRLQISSDRFSVYVHVPFCARKCSYCDFYSIEGTSLKDGYLTALRQEISRASRRGTAATVSTIYIGGGTPSLLTPGELEGILTAISGQFRVAPDAEVTLEVNPGTVSLDLLNAFREIGINRLSIGVQSFNDRVLAFLGRIHSGAEARVCLEHARASGFDNVNMDLIFAIPGLTREAWQHTLTDALAFAPEHISAYSLIVEEHTPLQIRVLAGDVVPVEEDEDAAHFALTMAVLEDNGYEHYEVSNYARPERRSLHNSAYWHHSNYLGFGPSAHSFWIDTRAGEAWRWANVRQVNGYCDLLRRDGSAVAMAEELGQRELVNERIFLALRSDGLSLQGLTADLGFEVSGEQRAYMHQLVARKLAVLEEGTLRLTREGFLVCDEICAHLMIS
jgi:oxygen-independent coproporphyrinogen III oxidase